MKNSWLVITLKCLSCLMLVGSSLQAEGLTDGRFEIPVSTFTDAQEEMLRDQFAIQDEAEEVEVLGESNRNMSEDAEVAGCLACKAYPGMFLTPKIISAQGDLIEMKDGSTWLIHPNDAIRTVLWAPSIDKIIVSQFGSKNYKYMLNIMSGGQIRDSVRANLSLSPYTVHPYRPLAISKIDPIERIITLNDGSRWSISGWDNYIYNDLVVGDMKQRRWVETDLVFVGYNSDWMNSWIAGYRRPNILININLNKIARVKLISR